MNLKDQVCTLDQSEKLKELGVRQDSIFVWSLNGGSLFIYPTTEKMLSSLTAILPNQDYFQDGCIETTSAFTVAELGELLIQNNISFDIQYLFDVESSYKWFCLVEGDSPFTDIEAFGKTEAEARANLLIRILEGNSKL